ncbi:MAG: dihydroorotase [Odoribacter sp.]|nr:dihydroorotase [Odoribacter sp.]
MKKIIQGGTIVNEGRQYKAHLVVENDIIKEIVEEISPELLEEYEIIDATGCYVIPGIIDDQVHFREPGLTYKGNIYEGSRAAAAGGVTSFMDMPNVIPATTTRELLEEKQELASNKSLINYSFYLGSTQNNIEEVKKVNPYTTCGIKVFMGSSTGNMLVDNIYSLEKLFAESPLLIAAHCEDTPTINKNLKLYKEKYGDNIPAFCHPLIRCREACFKSSSLAASIARKYNARLHILHLSTKEEIELLDKGELSQKRITGEACVHHLWFNDTFYKTKGNFIKWNPAIKTEGDRVALLNAVNKGYIDIVATDHAPHTLEEKERPYLEAPSGGPLVQHSLIVMLQLMEKGEISLENIVQRMCHAPAELFDIEKRGYLRPEYKADICIFKKDNWTVEKDNILYKCGWSPLEGDNFDYKVMTTIVNGNIVYNKGQFLDNALKGEMLTFTR